MLSILLNKFPALVAVGSYLQNKYILSLIILFLFVILAKLVLFIFSKYLEKFAAKTETEFDDLIFAKTKRPVFYLILAYGLKLSLLNLEIDGVVSNLIATIMAIMFVIILDRIVEITVEVWGKTFAKKTKTKIDNILIPMIHKTIKVIFVIIAFIWILDIWNINITPYLAGVGISGMVLGLALQDSLKNVFGGISLILDKTFRVGDKIKIESGNLGEVYDIGLRSTKIRTYDNEIIMVPNGHLANSRIQNYTRPTAKIRVGVNIGVEYGNNIKHVQKIVVKTIKSMKDVLDDPAPAAHFFEMGDFSLKFKAYFWVDSWKNAYTKKLEATEKIYDALNKSKIGIPFPTRTIYLQK